MPYPSENTITEQRSDYGYSVFYTAPDGTIINGPYKYDFHNGVVNRRRRTIHPATGNAPRLGGFKLCRPWSRSAGEMSWSSSSSKVRVISEDLLGQRDNYDYDNGYSAWTFGCSTGNLLPGPPMLPGSNMINAALVAALNKLKDQDIHVGNFIAESDKTLKMFATNVKRIASGVEKFRKANPKDWLKVITTETGNLARNKWCEIPNLWLELQYGWRPLLQDIYGAIHHLTRGSRYKVPYIRVKSHKQSLSSDVMPIVLDRGLWTGQEARVKYEDQQDVWVQLVYGVSNPALAELSSLGLLNPAEIVWEVTKYSFVVDWLVPVGNWLSALTADAGFTFISGSQSMKSVRKVIGVTRYGAWPDKVVNLYSTSYLGYPTLPKYSGSFTEFQRTCYADTPVPGLYVKNPLSAEHVANGLSLLVQAFR